MIDSTRWYRRTPPLERFASSGSGAARPSGGRADRVATKSVAFLRAELLRQPAIRPEAVERARALAADPNYPPPSINQTLARLILAAPDWSEHEG